MHILICFRLINLEGLRIVAETLVRAVGDYPEVYDRSRPESVAFVQRERLALPDRLMEVRHLRSRVLEGLELLLEPREVRSHAPADTSLRPFDVRCVLFPVVPVEDDLGAIRILVLDTSPAANRVIMLLVRINKHLHGTLLILSDDVLHRVKIVLAHVSQATAVVIPVTTK